MLLSITALAPSVGTKDFRLQEGLQKKDDPKSEGLMTRTLNKWKASFYYNAAEQDSRNFATCMMFAMAVHLERPIVVLTMSGAGRLEEQCKVYGLRQIVKSSWGQLKVDQLKVGTLEHIPLPPWRLLHIDALLDHVKSKTNPSFSIILYHPGHKHFDFFHQSWMKWDDPTDGVADTEDVGGRRSARAQAKQPARAQGKKPAEPAPVNPADGDSDDNDKDEKVSSHPSFSTPPPLNSLFKQICCCYVLLHSSHLKP